MYVKMIWIMLEVEVNKQTKEEKNRRKKTIELLFSREICEITYKKKLSYL